MDILYSCISNFKHHRCEDARDKVFGIQALLDPATTITVDYSNVAFDVYIKVLHKFGTVYELDRPGTKFENSKLLKFGKNLRVALGLERMADYFQLDVFIPGFLVHKPSYLRGQMITQRYERMLRERDTDYARDLLVGLFSAPISLLSS
jgi:hypothetical protein